MFEELLNEDEIHPGEVYEKIYVGKTTKVDKIALENFINSYTDYSNKALKDELMKMVFAKEVLMDVEDY